MAPSVEEDPRYGVALLRIALKMRSDPAADLGVIVRQTVHAMDLDQQSFRRYLTKNMDTLKDTVGGAESPELAFAYENRKGEKP